MCVAQRIMGPDLLGVGVYQGKELVYEHSSLCILILAKTFRFERSFVTQISQFLFVVVVCFLLLLLLLLLFLFCFCPNYFTIGTNGVTDE